MLSVITRPIMLSGVMLNVVLLSVITRPIMLSVVIPSFVMLNVDLLSVIYAKCHK